MCSFKISYFKSGSSQDAILSLDSFLWKFSYISNGNATWPWPAQKLC